MKLVHFEKCALLRLAMATRTHGQAHLRHVATEVQSKFTFESWPQELDEVDSGLEFRNGLHKGVGIAKLGIYHDGVVVQSASNTDFLEELYSDFVTWAGATLGLSFVETHQSDTLFESNVIVESSKNIASPLGLMVKLQKAVGNYFRENSNMDAPFLPVGFVLSPDLNKIGGFKPVPFRIERRSGTDFSANLFYCTAPLKTSQHIELLEIVEAMI